MSGDRFFVDTNVLLYTYDISNEAKRKRARLWMDWLWQNAAAHVSWQVLQEFYYNAVLKLGVPPDQARSAVRAWSEWRPPDVTLGLFDRAWFWMDQTHISFWDALIVAAAERARCRWLLSEDFQAGRLLGTVTIVNPFLSEPGSSTAIS
ncbi:MAG: PIN domain-containing protein [Acidobacteriia bacterium]|nr:PIN domain-containing protein [Terriglobia bacterium]